MTKNLDHLRRRLRRLRALRARVKARVWRWYELADRYHALGDHDAACECEMAGWTMTMRFRGRTHRYGDCLRDADDATRAVLFNSQPAPAPAPAQLSLF